MTLQVTARKVMTFFLEIPTFSGNIIRPPALATTNVMAAFTQFWLKTCITIKYFKKTCCTQLRKHLSIVSSCHTGSSFLLVTSHQSVRKRLFCFRAILYSCFRYKSRHTSFFLFLTSDLYSLNKNRMKSFRMNLFLSAIFKNGHSL